VLEACLPVQRPVVDSLSGKALRRLRQRNMLPEPNGEIARSRSFS
jgi:hypothetical protein